MTHPEAMIERVLERIYGVTVLAVAVLEIAASAGFTNHSLPHWGIAVNLLSLAAYCFGINRRTAIAKAKEGM